MIFRLFRLCLPRVRLLQMLCAVALLAACSPSYNWREMVVADGHATAAFPARVQTETRTITLNGETLSFTLTSAQVEKAMFAIGSAPLPEEIARDPVAREALGQAVMRSLYVNLGAQAPPSLPDFGDEIVARGRMGQQAGWLMARVWVTDTMLIDAVAAGTDQDLPLERAQEFVRSVKLHR